MIQMVCLTYKTHTLFCNINMQLVLVAYPFPPTSVQYIKYGKNSEQNNVYIPVLSSLLLALNIVTF